MYWKYNRDQNKRAAASDLLIGLANWCNKKNDVISWYLNILLSFVSRPPKYLIFTMFSKILRYRNILKKNTFACQRFLQDLRRF